VKKLMLIGFLFVPSHLFAARTSSVGSGMVILSTNTIGADNFIWNTSTLQSGATFYVSSGTVGGIFRVFTSSQVIAFLSTDLSIYSTYQNIGGFSQQERLFIRNILSKNGSHITNPDFVLFVSTYAAGTPGATDPYLQLKQESGANLVFGSNLLKISSTGNILSTSAGDSFTVSASEIVLGLVPARVTHNLKIDYAGGGTDSNFINFESAGAQRAKLGIPTPETFDRFSIRVSTTAGSDFISPPDRLYFTDNPAVPGGLQAVFEDSVLIKKTYGDGALRFADTDASNYISHRASSSLPSNTTYTWTVDGSADDVLTTDGSGNLSFKTVLSTHTIYWPAAATLPMQPAESYPSLGKDQGTYVDQQYLNFGATTDQCRSLQFRIPPTLDTAGSASFVAHWYSTSTTQSSVVWDIRHNGGRTEGQDPDIALSTVTASADLPQTTAGQFTFTNWGATISSLTWAANEQVDGQICRDANNASDTHTNARLVGFAVDIPIKMKLE